MELLHVIVATCSHSPPEGARGRYDSPMSSRRGVFAALVAVLFLLLLSPPASAETTDPVATLQECVDQAEDHDGELPTCTEDGDGYVASWPDDSMMEDDDFGGFSSVDDEFDTMFTLFWVLFVLVILAGVGTFFWKVSTARTIATRSGMDPDMAAQMVFLTDNGLDATYLAANLRPSAEPAAVPVAERLPATAAQRLAELKGLLDDGLITQAEHDKRRTAIIDAV